MSVNLLEVFSGVVRKFDEHDVRYMIVGSVASMIYGEPRLTHDMDLVIDLLPKDAAKIANLFDKNEFYCPPVEVISAEIIHRGQFNLLHQPSGLKIDLMVRKQTEHALTEFARRSRVPLWQGVEAYLAAPEDVIIKKLDFLRQGGSEKHIQDIRGILGVTAVDQKYLQDWITELGLAREWARVQ